MDSHESNFNRSASRRLTSAEIKRIHRWLKQQNGKVSSFERVLADQEAPTSGRMRKRYYSVY